MLANARDHLHRQQRMSSELVEVIVNAHAFEAQHIGPPNFVANPQWEQFTQATDAKGKTGTVPPGTFGPYLQVEVQRWARVIREAGVRPE